MSQQTIETKVKEVAKSLGSFGSFRMKLVIIKHDNEYLIYHGQIFLYEEMKPKEPYYDEIYAKNNISVIDFSGVINELQELLLQLSRPQPFNFKWPGYFDIGNRISAVSEGLFPKQEAHETFGFDEPFNEVRMGLERKVYPQGLRLVEFRSLNDMIRDKLGVNLDRYNGLQNAISIILFSEFGHIKNVEYSPQQQKLTAEIVYDKKEEKNYMLKIFVDFTDGKSISDRIELNDRIEYHLHPNTRYELRLIYKDTIVDKYIKYHNENDALLEDRIITEFKKKVTSIKPSIIADTLLLGEMVESRLTDAETKIKNPEDAIQSMAEAMEFVCSDYCKLFDIEISKVGLELHDKIVKHWKEKSGKKWTDLKFQTGVRHVIRIASLKRHEKYKPFFNEAVYLLLLSWRGYYEILRMIKDIQEKR